MLYTLKEVAKELNFSINTIRAWRRLGKLKVVKVNGKAIRVTEEELNRLKGGC